MSCYPTSTQRRFWTLSRDEIQKRRSDARARAIESAREAKIAAGEPAGPDDGPEPLTPEEETLLRRYYEAKILKVCAAFGMPSKVQATAVTLFKRFLLGTSLLQHNAKVIMLTAIYCACKVEENYISAEEFCKGMGQDTDASRVLNAELTLLAGLRFQLVTYSPYRALDGFRRDLEAEAVNDAEVATPSERLDACAAAAREVTDRQMLTDAPLMHAPGRLALAALRSAARQLGVESVTRYVSRAGAGGDGAEGAVADAAAVARSLDEIDEIVAAEGKEPNEDVVRDIDKKLKTWRTSNPAPKAEGEKGEKREAKRRKSEAATRDAEDAALG